MIGIFRIRRSSYAGAVVENIAPTLPAWEQDFRLELAACVGIYGTAVDWSRSAFGCGGRVEGAGSSWSDERVEVLGDGVVDGAAGDAEEVWRVQKGSWYERELGRCRWGDGLGCY